MVLKYGNSFLSKKYINHDFLEHKLIKRKIEIQLILSLNRNFNTYSLKDYFFILTHPFTMNQTSILTNLLYFISNKLQLMIIPPSQQKIIKMKVHKYLSILNNKSSLNSSDEKLISLLLQICHYLYHKNVEEFYSDFQYKLIEKNKIFIKQLLNETEYSVNVYDKFKMLLITLDKFKTNQKEFMNIFKESNYNFLVWIKNQLNQKSENQIKIHYCIWSILYNIVLTNANTEIIKCLIYLNVFNNLLFIIENYKLEKHTVVFTISIKCLLLIKQNAFQFRLLYDDNIKYNLNNTFFHLQKKIVLFRKNIMLSNLYQELIKPL